MKSQSGNTYINHDFTWSGTCQILRKAAACVRSVGRSHTGGSVLSDKEGMALNTAGNIPFFLAITQMLTSIHKFGHEIIRNPIFVFENIWLYFGQLLRVLSCLSFKSFAKVFPSNKNLTSSRGPLQWSCQTCQPTLIAPAPKAQKSVSGEDHERSATANHLRHVPHQHFEDTTEDG